MLATEPIGQEAIHCGSLTTPCSYCRLADSPAPQLHVYATTGQETICHASYR